MNRRKLVAHAVSLVPGVAPFRGDTWTSGQSTALADYPSSDLAALRGSQNTEKVAMELLQLCLERIGWKGDVCDWQNKLDQALGRVQSWLASESDSVLMLITGFQMDCLKSLCRFASAGNEAQTLLSALLLCDAFLPFNHWVEEGFLIGNHYKMNELARRHPEIHVLLGSAARRIPPQELERYLADWELGNRSKFMTKSDGNANDHTFFQFGLEHHMPTFRKSARAFLIIQP